MKVHRKGLASDRTVIDVYLGEGASQRLGKLMEECARMSLALDLQGVSSGYGHHLVIRDVSLSVEQGHLTALIGPNGHGKTTLAANHLGAGEPQSRENHLSWARVPIRSARTKSSAPASSMCRRAISSFPR